MAGFFKKLLRTVAPIAVGLIPGLGPITAGVLRAGIGGLSAASAARDARKEQAGAMSSGGGGGIPSLAPPTYNPSTASLDPYKNVDPFALSKELASRPSEPGLGIGQFYQQPSITPEQHFMSLQQRGEGDNGSEENNMAAGGMAYGGIASIAPHEYKAGGRYLSGPGDGMSDDIKANIDGEQEARLADGEFVIPADVVSHLGNGSSNAGAKKLHEMMERIRHARTGNPKQGKQVKPEKYLPA